MNINDIKRIFSRGSSKNTQTSQHLDKDELPLTRWSGNGCNPLTVQEYLEPYLHPDTNFKKIVEDTRSFVDLLNPRLDLGDNKIGLQDFSSVGKMFTVVCTTTEARSEAALQTIFDKVQHAIAHSCPQVAPSPWITQWFIQDDSEFLCSKLTTKIGNYANEFSDNSMYTDSWLNALNQHIKDLTHINGLFVDPSSVSNKWRIKHRTVRLCIWRIIPAQNQKKNSSLERVCSQLVNSLAHAGVKLMPCDASELYEWFSHWFVPKPEKYTGFSSTEELLQAYPWNPTRLERSMSIFSNAASSDISRASLHGTVPWTWKKPGVWWFQGKPSRFITVDQLLSEPNIGQLTHELKIGETVGTLWDQMPDKSIWSMTIVHAPQNQVEQQILKVKGNAIGDGAAALERKSLSDLALNEIAKGNPIYRVFCGVYIFGEDLKDLDTKTEQVLATLLSHKIRPIVPRYDPISLDSYIRALPFGFVPEQDQRHFARRARLWFSSHIARMVPVYGRSTGTNFPGCLMFNRGAEPIMFDPLNFQDRTSNAHALVLGPTGSGKTAMIIYILLHTMAIHRPRVFLITALPTFGLFAEHCNQLNMSVNKVQINGLNDVTLPPFRDAQKLLQENNGHSSAKQVHSRDLLGEMELQARLMITGGQKNEENDLRRDDIDLIRATIIEAAHLSKSESRSQTLTSDLSNCLYRAAETGKMQGRRLTKRQRDRVVRMAGAINVFCTGLNGKLFNREGQLWPKADITVVELNLLTRRGYEDKLAVALTSLFAAINNQIEIQQYQNRQTIVLIDEAHILLKNPLVSPYINRISAMWRSFGAWLWIATQNLRQFPDNAKELLNQPEWWYCLSMDKDEVEQIDRFKSLTKEQKALILSTRKSPGLFTEGVLISPRLLTIFRNTPPSLALALSQTDKNEKAERSRLMKTHQISELEAAYMIAKKLRELRKKAVPR